MFPEQNYPDFGFHQRLRAVGENFINTREEKRTGLQFHLNFCLSELASPANVEYEKEKVWQM